MKTILVKANESSLRVHWLLQKEKHVALYTKPKGKFVMMRYML